MLFIQGVFKKRPNICYRDFILQHFKHCPFKVVPSTGDTPFPTFLPLLECFLERSFCDGAQFSYRIVLNICVFKKRPNFLNSSPTSKEGALRLLSVPSGRFWQQTAICPLSLWALVVELHPLNWARAQCVQCIFLRSQGYVRIGGRPQTKQQKIVGENCERAPNLVKAIQSLCKETKIYIKFTDGKVIRTFHYKPATQGCGLSPYYSIYI
jgi:hypothetical protein